MTETAPPAADDAVLRYIGRRSVSAQWRGFVRCLLETLDANLEPEGRDALLRIVGERIALLHPLPACDSIALLQSRMNDALAAMDWGFVDLVVEDHGLRIRHGAAPAVATDNDADGAWIAAVLEGLFSAWIGAQDGAQPDVQAQRDGARHGRIELVYGAG